MSEFTVTITPAEEKALLTNMVSIQEWIDNAIHNKARQCMDAIIKNTTDQQPKKISNSIRDELVLNASVETALQRKNRVEAKIEV